MAVEPWSRVLTPQALGRPKVSRFVAAPRLDDGLADLQPSVWDQAVESPGHDPRDISGQIMEEIDGIIPTIDRRIGSSRS